MKKNVTTSPDLMEKTRAAETLINRVNRGPEQTEDLSLMYALTAFCGMSAEDAASLVKSNRRDKQKAKYGKSY